MWAYESVFYQFYPLGLCGAPFENDGVLMHRIKIIENYIPHLEKLGVNAVYFSPIFESDTHGYNTKDYKKIDCRLGTNDDFKQLCKSLHEKEIKIVLDGVFNHVGRGFWAFQDVLEKRWDSAYKDWFHISFEGNSNYNDGLWYEGWEGNYDLVKLNLRNEEVIQHTFDAVKYWVDEFDIDGLRLDVAYCLDHDFMRRLREFTNTLKPDFFLLGETVHGDYNQIMNDGMLHAVTNYECYKGLYSSFNSMNMFEICHSLNRQFGPENWTLYKGKHLLAFVDNHDVTRVSSILNNEKHLPLIYGLMMGMPGIPCIYYGSEWGTKGEKHQGDPALRPMLEYPGWNELTDKISSFINQKKHSHALNYGGFQNVVLTNKQCIFKRQSEKETVYVAVNADEWEYTAYMDFGTNKVCDMLTGQEHQVDGKITLSPYSVMYLRP